VLAALGGRREAARAEYFASLRNWNVNRGSVIVSPSHSSGGEEVEPQEAPERVTPLPREAWVRNDLLGHYLKKLLHLAAEHRVPVFLVLAPLNPELQQHMDLSGMSDFHTRLACYALSLYPGAVVIDGRYSGYARRVFVDKTHLNETGAVAFSDALGRIIAERLAGGGPGGRWVSLPRYREPDGGVDVETFDESKLALFSGGAARR
jgi:hypothetical protein